MIIEVFEKIEQRLLSTPCIKYVSEDWGQLDFYENQPPVQFPCVLFDTNEADYSSKSQGGQIGTGTVSIRIADYRPSQVSSLSPGRAQPLEMYVVLNEVYKALQGLSGEWFTPLSRVKLLRCRRDDGIREFEMTFKFGFTDNAAMKPLQRVSVDPVIKQPE